MTDLRSRLNPPFRHSPPGSPSQPDIPAKPVPPTGKNRENSGNSLRLGKSRNVPSNYSFEAEERLAAVPANVPSRVYPPPQNTDRVPLSASLKPTIAPAGAKENCPRLVVEEVTPPRRGRGPFFPDRQKRENPDRLRESDAQSHSSGKLNLAARRQSPLSFDHTHLFPSQRPTISPTRSILRTPTSRHRYQVSRDMPHRKIWIKRPNAVATQVSITEDDLVDDVKDMVLRKYANSLGRNFDPPDVALKIVLGPHSSRHTNDRILGPDENISKILDMHYPVGQAMDEALLVDVPQRRTPKQSPHILPYYVNEDVRPAESGTDYFPPMPVVGTQSPHPSAIVSAATGLTAVPRPSAASHPHSIAVLETGHVPNLPSPSATTRIRHQERTARPRYVRQATTSPTILIGPTHSQTHEAHKILPASSAVPTPPVPQENLPHRTATPPPARTASPRPSAKSRRTKKNIGGENSTSPGQLNATVPPINVLIVEDNIINLRLLEAFLKRLNVRWSTAMNGEIAVNKWREGGFHLVLMDIQLPVMNGLDATKEIRRLERVNRIGVFVNNAGRKTPCHEKEEEEAINGAFEVDGSSELKDREAKPGDKLENLDLFKSSVIIVALTASSLQSDRHEALAVGCNDFLTKPVNFDWLSRKVMEWGCMQALIDFDGWRKWKELASTKASPSKKNNPPAGKKAVNGVGSKGPKSPLMEGKHRQLLGVMDGGNSSGDEKANGSGNEGI